MTASYFSGFLSTIVYLITISILLRLPLKVAPLVLQISVAILIHVIGTIIGVLFIEGMPYWPGATLYWFAFMCYLYIFNAFYKSISLTIVYDLSKQPDQSATIQEIYERYIKAKFIDRIEILIEGGQVERQGDCFKVTPRGRSVANRIRITQKIFGIEGTGVRGMSNLKTNEQSRNLSE